ncbi:MAG: hypothetical protein MUF87_07925 [Anaerolineae bacterium]|nr:hypothetical protein [Anaerolineae bacterium]
MSGKIVTFVCIFRENIKKTIIDKRRKKEKKENLRSKYRTNPTLALTHTWGGNWRA